MGSHSIKSIHLGHKCPLTGYHQACSTSDIPRTYDCPCQNKVIKNNRARSPNFDPNIRDRECSFLHLSTNPNNYVKYQYEANEVREMKIKRNELIKVMSH